MVDHLQSRVTPWRQYASHVKFRGTLSKMDVLNIRKAKKSLLPRVLKAMDQSTRNSQRTFAEERGNSKSIKRIYILTERKTKNALTTQKETTWNNDSVTNSNMISENEIISEGSPQKNNNSQRTHSRHLVN